MCAVCVQVWYAEILSEEARQFTEQHPKPWCPKIFEQQSRLQQHLDQTVLVTRNPSWQETHVRMPLPLTS